MFDASQRKTLNGGPAGRAEWRAVLPNKKHELFAGWRAAEKGGPAGCTTGWASVLHRVKAVCTLCWAAEKAGPEGCPFLQPHPPFPQPDGPPFLCCPPAHPSVLCAAARQTAENSPFPFGLSATLQLVLSHHKWSWNFTVKLCGLSHLPATWWDMTMSWT